MDRLTIDNRSFNREQAKPQIKNPKRKFVFCLPGMDNQLQRNNDRFYVLNTSRSMLLCANRGGLEFDGLS